MGQARTAEEREDEFQLRDLAYRYGRLMDDRAYERLPDVFTETGGITGPGYEMRGYEALDQGLRALEQYDHTLHCVHNSYFELDGDRATGEVYCVANHIRDKDGVPFKLDMGIRYQDTYERTPAGWRIQVRIFTLIWEQDLPLVMGADGSLAGG